MTPIKYAVATVNTLVMGYVVYTYLTVFFLDNRSSYSVYTAPFFTTAHVILLSAVALYIISIVCSWLLATGYARSSFLYPGMIFPWFIAVLIYYATTQIVI